MKAKLLVLAVAAGLSCAAVPAFATDTATIHQTGTNGSATVNQTGNTGENTATIDQGPGDANNASIDQRDIVASAGVPGSTAALSQTGNNNVGSIHTFRDGPGLVAGKVTQNGDFLAAFVTINDSANATTVVDQTGSSNLSASGQLDGVRNASIQVTQRNTYNSAFIGQLSGSDQSANVLMTGNGNVAVLEQSGIALDARTEQSGDNNTLNITQMGTGLLDSASITQVTSFNAANITQVGSGLNASIVQDTGNGNSAAINQHF